MPYFGSYKVQKLKVDFMFEAIVGMEDRLGKSIKK